MRKIFSAISRVCKSIYEKFFLKIFEKIDNQKKWFVGSSIFLLILIVIIIIGLRVIIVNNPQTENQTFRVFSINGIKTVKEQTNVVAYDIHNPYQTDYETNTVYPLLIYFQGSTAKLDDVGKIIEKGITISPSLEGTWKWYNDSVLRFEPKNDWEIGKIYTVKFADDFFPSHLTVKKTFKFETRKFSLSVSKNEFYIDTENPRVKKVSFTVNASHPVNSSTIQKFITIQARKDTKFFKKDSYEPTISFGKNFTEIYIVSENIDVPSKSAYLVLDIDSGLVSILGGNAADRVESFVEVPGVSDYVRINYVRTQIIKTDDQRYQQVIMLNTKGKTTVEALSKKMKIYLLPEEKPDIATLKNVDDWLNPNFMTAEVLALSEVLAFKAQATEFTYDSQFSFIFNADTKRHIYIVIDNGLEFYGQYIMGETYKTVLPLRAIPKEISILSNGALLNLYGSKKLAMFTRGLAEINYNVGRVKIDDINHLLSQSSGFGESFSFHRSSFNEYNVTEQYSSKQTIDIDDPRAPTYFSFDFSDYLKTIPDKNLRYGLFIFEVNDGYHTATNDYDYYNQYDDYDYYNEYDNYASPENKYVDRRLILVTDLGFYVKENRDNSRAIFVQSLSTGKAVADALVQVIGLNGFVVAHGYTDNQGYMQIPSLKNLNTEHSPTVITVSKSNDLSFMRWRDGGQYLDYSNFSISGEFGADDAKNISAYLFSDRGIYRPGDEMKIGLIVKSGDWKVNLASTPFECTIVDAKGSPVYSQHINLNASGFEEISYKTMEYSPTGVYEISLYLIKEKNVKYYVGSTQVKVEEFLPDNLSIKTRIEPTENDGWIYPQDIKGFVEVSNLFGTPAHGNIVKARMTLSPGYSIINKYKGFTFSDPLLAEQSYQDFLGETETDEQGNAEFDIDISNFGKNTYLLQFYTEAFEKASGRSVSSARSVMVSPLEYLIGYKADGSLTYIHKKSVRKVQLQAINNQLEKTYVKDLRLIVEERKYVSVLVQQSNGLYAYKSIERLDPVNEKPLSLNKDGYEMYLDTQKAGDYRITVKDANDYTYVDFSYSIIGDENIQRSLDRTAELEIQLNKYDFKPGEDIEIFIKVPYEGSGLITIERDKVYSHTWFVCNGLSTTQKIKVPANLEGNAYINIAFARSMYSKEIYMSPLSYGVVNFSVSNESKQNPLSLFVPGEIKPGKNLQIEYKTAKPGKIIVYAIDEGILQVARYSLPDPLSYFIRKRALEVRTSQVMNLVLPEYDVLTSLMAMGGGSDADFLAQNLNPFRRKLVEPVAYWSGILDSGPQIQTTSYKIPGHFNGKLRVMAIAVSDDSIGRAENSVIVRDTFTIKPNMPTSAAPGDEFEVAVSITNGLKNSGQKAKIALDITSSKNLQIISEYPKILEIDENKDNTFTFMLKALNEAGSGEITITASNIVASNTATSTKESSTAQAFLSVRPSVPYHIELTSGIMTKPQLEVPLTRKMYQQLSSSRVSASYSPLAFAPGLEVYLNTYPYGCTEQITSATYPYLYSRYVKTNVTDQKTATAAVQRTIAILHSRQKASGAIGYWTSSSYDIPYINAYVGHFLFEARERGYYVPDSMYNSLLDTLKNIASGNSGEEEAQAYAIYVLTLNDIVTTNFLEKLTNSIKNVQADWRRGFTDMYIAASYLMLKQDSVAQTYLTKSKRNFSKSYQKYFYDELSYEALYIYMIAKHAPQRLSEIKSSSVRNLVDLIAKNKYSSYSAFSSLRALDTLTDSIGEDSINWLSIAEISKDKKATPLTLKGFPAYSSDFSFEANSIQFANTAQLDMYYQITQSGFDLEMPTQEVKNNIEIYKEYYSENGTKTNSFILGETVKVKLRFRALHQDAVGTMIAFIDMFPSGLEADIMSIRNNEKTSLWKPEYTDIREDRIILYGTITQSMSEYEYSTKAISKGSFIVPPFFAEALYDKTVWGLKPSEPVKIQ